MFVLFQMELQNANQQMGMVADRGGCVEGQADSPQLRLIHQQQGLSFQVCFKHFPGGKVKFPGLFRLKQRDSQFWHFKHFKCFPGGKVKFPGLFRLKQTQLVMAF